MSNLESAGWAKGKKQKLKDPFYQTWRWRKFSKLFKIKNPFCMNCLRVEFYRKSKVTDHIIPRHAGGSDYNNKNLWALCKGCDDKKRGMEKAGTWIVPTATVNENGKKALIVGGEIPNF